MGLAPSGFFALRTPLLPTNDWPLVHGPAAAPENRERDALRRLVADPAVREAIFVGSPDLEDSIDAWLNAPESERGTRVARALSRYLARMAWRPTPFGLFAGITVGTIGDRTRLRLAPRSAYRRHARLDTGYLDALAQSMARDPSLRAKLRYTANSSCYPVGGRMRYIEARTGDATLDADPDSDDDVAARRREVTRSYSLADVTDSPYLRAALEVARDGADVATIASALASLGDRITIEAATRYVDELIDNQLLVPVLPLPITGVEPLSPFAEALRDSGADIDAANRLAEVQEALAALDRGGVGAATSRYREMGATLGALPAPVVLGRLFQVDLFKPAEEAQLGATVVSEIVRGADVLHRLQRPRVDPLARFRQRFVERYEGRAVPLPLVLDDETGIGVDEPTSAEPLLRGVALDGADTDVEVTWGERETILLAKLTDACAAGDREMTLRRDDIDALSATITKAPPPLSRGLSAMVTIAARSDADVDKGNFQIFVSGLSGPAGVELLGRFCHGDGELCRRVVDHLRAADAADPDAIYAEIVHSPAGRLANILLRPRLREHEIVYLGDSGAPRDKQIGVSDLVVTVEGDHVVLRLSADGRRVVPRMTTAHNWAPRRNLATYRFLCMLQSQGITPSARWDWGALASAAFLPRVRYGRVVLSLAQWRVRGDEVRPLLRLQGDALVAAVAAMRERRSIPRHVSQVEADNVLPIDLETSFGANALVRASRNGESVVVLQEVFPEPDALCVTGPEGRFTHELLVPLVNTIPTSRKPRVEGVETRRSTATDRVARRFTPGSEWLYARVYTGPAMVDRLLRRAIGPLVRQAGAAGWIDRWFFIRYADPDWHLRLRLHGDPAALHEKVLPALHSALAPLLTDGSTWRLDLGTYEREVERYGGEEAIDVAERVFEADSDSVLEIIERVQGLHQDDRWRLALYGIDRLFLDFGLDATARRDTYARLRDMYIAEHRPRSGLRKRIGDRFRNERSALEALLDDQPITTSPLARAADLLRRRSEQLSPLVVQLRALDAAGRLSVPLEQITPSFAHMFAVRLLRYAARDQELVLYDFLARLYETRAARNRMPGARAAETAPAVISPANR